MDSSLRLSGSAMDLMDQINADSLSSCISTAASSSAVMFPNMEDIEIDPLLPTNLFDQMDEDEEEQSSIMPAGSSEATILDDTVKDELDRASTSSTSESKPSESEKEVEKVVEPASQNPPIVVEEEKVKSEESIKEEPA